VKVWRYRRWDGTQEPFSLEAEPALDAVSDWLMEGLSLADALEWMRRSGFELAGLDARVMGVDELLAELRDEIRSLEDRYHLDQAFDDMRRRLEEILRREEQAQRERHGYESRRMNEFLERRHAPAERLSERIERFRDWSFDDPQAGRDFEALLGELERMRSLEGFQAARGRRFRGGEAADYDTAQGIRERIEALERLARDLAEGRFEAIDPGRIGDLLDPEALRSLVILRDLEPTLRRAGYLRPGSHGLQLTPRAIRRIGAQALATVYGALRKGRPGGHETVHGGIGVPRPDETRPWQFGDAFEVDVVRSLLNAVRRSAGQPPAERIERMPAGRTPAGDIERMPAGTMRPGPAGAAAPIAWSLADLEVRETDLHTQCTTVLALDMSWSMSWAGRFPAAKRVALALDHLIRTRFPRDRFFVVGFSTRARELRIAELPEATWDMGEPFTNLQEALMLAERLIARNPSPSAQVLVVTDGQPTAYFRGRELRVEWPMGMGGVSPHAAAETLQQVRRITRRGVTINTFMLDAAPELVAFVEQMTRINKGRALYTSPARLGSYVMVDYLARRRKLHR
jgi:uncharacterized protein with von Willebrand factor type A (vWA) domain